MTHSFDSTAARAAISALEAATTEAEYDAAHEAFLAACGLTDRQVLHLPSGDQVISHCHPGDPEGHVFAEGLAEALAISQT